MELCKNVQVEEYVIHVVGSTNFYTHLQFSLLASTWFPRPLGVCLWSALHMLLVLYKALMLLVLFSIAFVLAVLMDAFLLGFLISFVLYTLSAIPVLLVFGIVVGIVWLWLVITDLYHTIPPQSQDPQPAPIPPQLQDPQPAPNPPQPQDPQPAPAVEEGGAAADGSWWRNSLTLSFVNHVILVSFPYRRAQLADLYREIVPWNDTIVI